MILFWPMVGGYRFGEKCFSLSDEICVEFLFSNVLISGVFSKSCRPPERQCVDLLIKSFPNPALIL